MDILSWNFIHFPVELLICEAVFLIKKPRREHFILRFISSLIIYFIMAGLWMYLIDSVQKKSLLPYVFLYLGYAVFTAFPIMMSFELHFFELIFVIGGGYATQHMCFALIRMALYLVNHSMDVDGVMRIFTQYFSYIIWAVMIYYLIIRKNEDKEDFSNEDARIAVFALILALAAVVLSVFYSYPADVPVNLYSGILCPAYGFLCCVLVLMMEYYVLRENRLKHERELMEQLLQMANSQQKSSKEAINIINMKCHDLKHQIKALTKMNDSLDRTEYVKEIQQAVSIYDAIFHTGCEALDYILREKSLIFNEYHVAFSCMADGALINYMSSADLYALMGNALDNAVERVIQEKEERRIISLHIKQHGDMVLIHLENYCSEKPVFKDDLPVTEKEDKNHHGFGVRSIRYIAEKYNGTMQMACCKNMFLLDILLPKN